MDAENPNAPLYLQQLTKSFIGSNQRKLMKRNISNPESLEINLQ